MIVPKHDLRVGAHSFPGLQPDDPWSLKQTRSSEHGNGRKLNYVCHRNLRHYGRLHGVPVVAVAPRFTSQDCSGCGERVEKSLSIRTHRCPSCGLVLDRDENAARNILQTALSGTAGQAGTGTPVCVPHVSGLGTTTA
ncbi:MAG: zinc ribbon domain-containing protein [Ktedonobacterales bacterium]